MCRNTYRIDQQTVECRNCIECERDRLNDWVGRCLLEADHSDSAYAVTFTYDESPANDYRKVVLHYEDVQRMLKRIRIWQARQDEAAGRPKGFSSTRYICSGEYGKKSARAHWHIVLFFRGEVPSIPSIEKRQNWDFWGHGFTYWQPVSGRAFFYTLKYIRKSYAKCRRFMMSKGPLIGFRGLEEMGRRWARAGIPINRWWYHHPNGLHTDGNKVVYRLKGKAREVVFNAYCLEWALTQRGEPPWTDAFLVAADYKARMDAEQKWRESCCWSGGWMEDHPEDRWVFEGKAQARVVWGFSVDNGWIERLTGPRWFYRADEADEKGNLWLLEISRDEAAAEWDGSPWSDWDGTIVTDRERYRHHHRHREHALAATAEAASARRHLAGLRRVRPQDASGTRAATTGRNIGATVLAENLLPVSVSKRGSRGDVPF